MARILCLLLLYYVLLRPISKANASGSRCTGARNGAHASIGGVVDYESRVGKEQKIAMELAFNDYHHSSTCSNYYTELHLHVRNSHGISTRKTVTAINLIQEKHAQVIIGTLQLAEASLISEIAETANDTTIISLTSPAMTSPVLPYQHPNLIQMSNDVSLHMHCIASIVGYFRWRKVTALYEQTNHFSISYGLITSLSDSLRDAGSEVDQHYAIPPVSFGPDETVAIQNMLNKLKNGSNRVFIVLQCSFELAMVLFASAHKMGMMKKGYVWIVSDEISSLLDSVDSAVLSNMQGVIGFKIYFDDTNTPFRQFKHKFRRQYGLEYPQEEENSSPSIFALRAYDATRMVLEVMAKSKEKFTSNLLLGDNHFHGLSASNISFVKGVLSDAVSFRIINVVGKKYNEIAFWSPEFGFSTGLAVHDFEKKNISGEGDDYVRKLSTIQWPGDELRVPKGWVAGGYEGNSLKIGVPAGAAFKQFVSVNCDQDQNETNATGFSILVFEAVVKLLPYYLPCNFVCFHGSYDEMVEQVHLKNLDAAVGDTEILADRYHQAQFSHPYVESGLVMVVTEKTENSNGPWLFVRIFTTEMWLLMAIMQFFTGFVIWFIERRHNPDLRGWEAILFVQREPLTSNLARCVLAPWLVIILVISASFTASLSSMLTVSKLQPSVVDIETLIRTNAVVGCNAKSFIGRYLTDVLHFKHENVKDIDSINDYPAALHNGSITAAFFVAPHAKVFMAKFCTGFSVVREVHKLGGFGFVFPKESSLVFDISEAILQATENGIVQNIENEMLSNFNCSSSKSQYRNDQGLGPKPFFGLFYISGTISCVAFTVVVAHIISEYWRDSGGILGLLINRRIWRLVSIFYFRSPA